MSFLWSNSFFDLVLGLKAMLLSGEEKDDVEEEEVAEVWKPFEDVLLLCGCFFAIVLVGVFVR